MSWDQVQLYRKVIESLLFFVKSIRIHLWSMDEKVLCTVKKCPLPGIVQYFFNERVILDLAAIHCSTTLRFHLSCRNAFLTNISVQCQTRTYHVDVTNVEDLTLGSSTFLVNVFQVFPLSSIKLMFSLSGVRCSDQRAS